MSETISPLEQATVTSVGQLVQVLRAFPPDTPVEAGLGYRDETDSYRTVTVSAVTSDWLDGRPDVTTVIVLGETGSLRAP
ncbi:MAG TPA: hypothetical protein VEP73_00145 [Actinomycetota bacterium]|nr:hypothetical protein [Actinomycetota bacterium]